jgi:hypothetical protein
VQQKSERGWVRKPKNEKMNRKGNLHPVHRTLTQPRPGTETNVNERYEGRKKNKKKDRGAEQLNEKQKRNLLLPNSLLISSSLSKRLRLSHQCLFLSRSEDNGKMG